MLWAGIDEAGYGPNLGPLVMTAVVARTEGSVRPDLWADPSGGISRAAGSAGALWLDDSKRLYRGGNGLDRLEAATCAVLDACGLAGSGPIGLADLVGSLCGGSLEAAEFTPWLEGLEPPPLPTTGSAERVASWLASKPLERGPWRVVAARSVVIGPARFNALLTEGGGSKAHVHAEAFVALAGWLRTLAGDDALHTRSDKHGGRHFYAELLGRALPGEFIFVGPEGPNLSRYDAGRMTFEFVPRADADDGLVALASIVSKLLRERWMAVFNAYWSRRLPGLKPTAGYPVDAARFRAEIAAHAAGLEPSRWWRWK